MLTTVKLILVLVASKAPITSGQSATFRFIDEFGEETNAPTEDDTFEVTCIPGPNEIIANLTLFINNRPVVKPSWLNGTTSKIFRFPIQFGDHNKQTFGNYSCRQNETQTAAIFSVGLLFCGRNSSSTCVACPPGDTCGLTVSGKVCSPNNWENFAIVCGNLGGITEDSRGPPYRLNHQYQSLAKMREVSRTEPDGGDQITIASTFYALCYYGNSDTWHYIAECAPGGCILNRGVPYINVSSSTNGTYFRPQLGDTVLFRGNFENSTQMFTFVCGDYEAYDGPTCVLRTRWNQSLSATNDSCAPGKTVSIFFSNFDENFGGETLVKLSCYTKWTRSYIFVLMIQNASAASVVDKLDCPTAESPEICVNQDAFPLASADGVNVSCDGTLDADVCKFKKLQVRNFLLPQEETYCPKSGTSLQSTTLHGVTPNAGPGTSSVGLDIAITVGVLALLTIVGLVAAFLIQSHKLKNRVASSGELQTFSNYTPAYGGETTEPFQGATSHNMIDASHRTVFI